MYNNWTKQETKQLFDLVYSAVSEGKGISRAFGEMAAKSGKSVNSIRSYYYSQRKAFEMMPEFTERLGIRTVAIRREGFETFSDGEIDALIEGVLTGRADGKSVRAVIAAMSGGDKKLALRLQNKYRSLVLHHKKRVQRVMNGMRTRGVVYFDPYLSTVIADGNVPVSDNIAALAKYIGELTAEERVSVVKLLLN